MMSKLPTFNSIASIQSAKASPKIARSPSDGATLSTFDGYEDSCLWFHVLIFFNVLIVSKIQSEGTSIANGSTVVDISIPLPTFRPSSLSLSRSPLL